MSSTLGSGNTPDAGFTVTQRMLEVPPAAVLRATGYIPGPAVVGIWKYLVPPWPVTIAVSALGVPAAQMTLASLVSPFTESNCRGYPVLISMEFKLRPLPDGSVAVHDPDTGIGVGIGVEVGPGVGPGAGVGVAIATIVGCGVPGRLGVTLKMKELLESLESLSVSIDKMYSSKVAGERNSFPLNWRVSPGNQRESPLTNCAAVGCHRQVRFNGSEGPSSMYS